MYIAELSCNHNRDWDICKAMVLRARDSGADVIKIQLFEADQMTLRRYTDRFLIKEGSWRGYLWDLYCRIMTPKEWLPRIVELGIPVMVSVFHPDMVDYCLDYGVKLFKVASPEVGYEDLIDELAFLECPVFVSTGCASREEIEFIVGKIKNLTLMHCVSRYPAPISSSNLMTLLDMRKFGIPLGLSDHSTSLVAPVVATVLGAVAIEKHFKIVEDCPDSAFSFNPAQFQAMVCACEDAKASLGSVYYPGGGTYKREWVDGRYVRTVKNEM